MRPAAEQWEHVMARRGWPVWASTFALLIATAVLSACARPATDGYGAPAMAPRRPATSQLLEAYGRLPLHFEENRGQADPSTRFLARADGGVVALTPRGFVVGLDGGGVELSFVGA